MKNVLHLYNRIWSEQIFPGASHDAIVIPIQKPGKDASDPKITDPLLSQAVCISF